MGLEYLEILLDLDLQLDLVDLENLLNLLDLVDRVDLELRLDLDHLVGL